VEHEFSISSLLVDSAASLGISITAEQSKSFMVYLDQLKTWNRTTNLTSITDDAEIVIKHFIDSIAAINAVDFHVGSLVCDVGTGAGFPGIPLKIMRQDLRMVLIEPSKKKASFLRYIVGLLRLNQMDIFEGSLESFAGNFTGKEKADYILARGIKYDFILGLSQAILSMNGKIIPFLSMPIDRTGLIGGATCENEYSFDLPMGLGHRVIASISMI
jgi:16S rRNA (guanine527-N7)-methyltransferase